MQIWGASNKKDFLIPFNRKIFDLGYSEKNKDKKGLFSKKCYKGTAYLDYRNTEDTPRRMQVEEGPLFYFYPFGKSKPSWQTRRVEKLQRKILEKNGFKYRLSCGHDYPIYGDGYCQFCNKDFQDEGLYCSHGCELQDRNQPHKFCKACLGPLSNHETIVHHIAYYPPKTVEVHTSCHKEIHSGSEEYVYLLPPQDDVDQFYKKGEYEPTSEDLARKKSEKDKRKQLKLLKKQRKVPSMSRIPRHNRDFYF